MRVGLLAPVAWNIPPRRYGPWEQVVSNLAEGLVGLGIEVTLFATAEAKTGANLSAVVPRPLGEDPSLDAKTWEWLHIGHALAAARDLDLLHNHMNCHPLAMSPLLDRPIVTTLHGSALLEPPTREIYRRFSQLPYVSISLAERLGCPDLNYVANVYNGIDLDQFAFGEGAGGYLVFLGRLSAKKGVHHAIELARRADIPLVIAAHIPADEQVFFDRAVRPHIDGRLVNFIGEVGPDDRNRLLGEALALLHLVTVPEPFGLSMAEALACGTPVIGFGMGSVPEVVADGETGFVVEDLDQAALAVGRLSQIDRRRCRRRVEERFTTQRMVAGYLDVYRQVLNQRAEGG